MTDETKQDGEPEGQPASNTQLDTGWIPNTGSAPLSLRGVDIKLNCDEPGWPGVDCIRYSQDPSRWDWQRDTGGTEITHYRATPGCEESNIALRGDPWKDKND